MLSNRDTSIAASCLDSSLRAVAEQVCSKEQRGFVRGRFGHDHILALQVAMEIFAHRPTCAPGVLLLDQAQAFASVFHTFLWAALRRQGVPRPVLRGLQGLYAGGTTRAYIDGETGRLRSPTAFVTGVRPRGPRVPSCTSRSFAACGAWHPECPRLFLGFSLTTWAWLAARSPRLRALSVRLRPG